jgi:hypothetical protein
MEAIAPIVSSAPTEDEVVNLPPPLAAPVFEVPNWNANKEPPGITRLNGGESFLDGVRRVAGRIGGESPVARACYTWLPGMRVAEDQVGIVLSNGQVKLRPPGAYRPSFLNPLVEDGAVVPVARIPGVEFDPLLETAARNPRIKRMELGSTYRQIVLQAQQIAVFEDQSGTIMATRGTYVYNADTEMRGVIDFTRMDPVIVERETEDTAAATTSAGDATRLDQHGRVVPAHQGHGTTVETTKRYIPAGYVKTVGPITIARPEKGFVAMHKDAKNVISMTEGICLATGSEDFVRYFTPETVTGGRADINDLGIEFGKFTCS